MQAARFDATPHGFIPNVGQLANEDVKFVLRDGGVTAYFTDRGFVLWGGQTAVVKRDGIEVTVPIAPRWELVGAKPVKPASGERFEHTVSFFRGNDPTRWRPSVPAFRDLRYPGILDGVELRVASLRDAREARHPTAPNLPQADSRGDVVSGSSGTSLSRWHGGREHGFEYSFHVQPHARPDLRFRYDGITGLEKALSGELIVRTATGHFTESRPVAWQWIDGTRHEVQSWFEVVSTTEYRIAVGAYDKQYELVVDPVLDWSTSIGGSESDQLNSVRVDPDGNVIVAGSFVSVDLPVAGGFGTTPGANGTHLDPIVYVDAYVAKLSADGTQLIWAGYLGSDGPYDSTAGRKAIAVDGAGDVYVCGFTESPVFPTTTGPSHAGLADAYVAKIAANGSQLLWSTLLGTADEDWGYAITLDAAGSVYLAGQTKTIADQDVLVAKLDGPSGAVLWSDYLGGSNEDRPAALVTDGSGVLIFGDTDSADFPATVGDTSLGGVNDAFVAKIMANGDFGWATFLGGSQTETGHQTLSSIYNLTFGKGDIARDSAGNIVVAGNTSSADFPGVPSQGVFQPVLRGVNDGFVAKLSADGTTVLWASYLGGSGPADSTGREDAPMSIAINPWDEILVSGWTLSSDFPVTPDALKSTAMPNGYCEAFLTKVSSSGNAILYSTYIGNEGWNDSVLGLAYDSGNILLSGWHYDTWFQITAGAYRRECDYCGTDTFVMKFLDAFIAHDGLESGNYSGGEGDWAGNWTVLGDTSILTSSGPHSGARHVRLRSSTGYLQRTVNVPPGSITLRLGFWAKVNSFESSDRADVLVRSTAAGFTTVASFTSAQGDNNYHYYEIDLTSFLPASQIHIAFDAVMNASNDNLYLDDIRLTGTSEPVPPVASAGADQTVTDADNSGAEIVILDGSASFDPDGGGIVAYEWKEGATVLGTGASISPSLTVGGPHMLTLTVTDDEGATASDTVLVTVNPAAPPPANPLHVGDLDGTSASSGKNWKATVVVTAHDGNHATVSGAAVSIQWGGGASGTASATTDSNGRCTFVSGNISKQTSTATLTIIGMTHSTLTYAAAANHDPDSDSNGTLITVNKP
jgi:hypothetical protein